MRADDAVRIRHMLDAAREALSFLRGRERADSTATACWCSPPLISPAGASGSRPFRNQPASSLRPPQGLRHEDHGVKIDPTREYGPQGFAAITSVPAVEIPASIHGTPTLARCDLARATANQL